MPVYSQYILNEFVINPSMAGIDGTTTINVTGRKQWLGWDNAPETYVASISARVLKSTRTYLGKRTFGEKIRKAPSGKVGLGAALLNDINGAVVRTNLNFSYAYHLDLNNGQLSFGLSPLIQQFRVDKNLAALDNQSGDPLSSLIGKSIYSVDAAFGVNYIRNKFSVGFSAFQLLQSPVKSDGLELYFDELKQVRHYYLTGLYRNNIKDNQDWEYESSLVLRATENLQVSVDLSNRFIYNKEYWAGLSLRSSGEIILLLGVNINRVYFGYSFDYGINELAQLSYGSHEAFMAIKLGDKARRYRYWERY